jgi:SAM-dependent methyltransferase
MKDAYVQFGCGLSAPAGWRNFDSSPVLRAQKVWLIGRLLKRPPFPPFPNEAEYGDIVRGLPLQPGSVAGIYCSHVLEHLSLEDLRAALRNVYRYLSPGGVFRIVVPDLERMIDDYVKSNDPTAAEAFMRSTMLGRDVRPRGIEALLRSWLGNSQHLWMWDYKSLSHELASAGFSGVRRAVIGDSADPQFKSVEDADRWNGALGVECVKS